MDKPQTLKGFRDFLPEKMIIRNEAIRRLRGIFEKYGFDEIQTPSLEYQEVLLGKYGEEAEKLMYLFKDPGQRNVGLRYDLTVPFARVASTYQDLPKPFKRYQIQPVWRAENTQKERWLTAIQSIDKLDKKTQEEVEQELAQKGISTEQTKSIFGNIKSASPDEFLSKTIEYTKNMGAYENVSFDPTLARGLDYYTGPIFESVVEEPKIGSITGGGRYDNLLKTLGGPDLPATGTTIGLDRVVDVVDELKLWSQEKTVTKVLVTVFNPELLLQSIKIASTLRGSGVNAELYPDEAAKLEKQLKYANNKGIPFVVLIGPEEDAKNLVQLKDMASGKSENITLEQLLKKIK